MIALKLLLMFFTVPGYSFVLQPRSTVMQIAGLDRDHLTELRDVFISAEERENVWKKAAKSTERPKEEQRSEGSPKTNPLRMPVRKEMTVEERRQDRLKAAEILDRNQRYEKGSEERLTAGTFSKSITLGEQTKREKQSVADTVDDLDTEEKRRKDKREDGLNLVPNSKRETNVGSIMVKTTLSDNTNNGKIVKSVKSHSSKTKEEAKYDETDVKFKTSDQMEKLRREIVEEERESKLVAGIGLREETRGDSHVDEKILTVRLEMVAEKGENKEREERTEKKEGIKNARNDELVQREKEDHILVPPLSTSSAQGGKESEIQAKTQIITQSQNPPSSPHHHKHKVPGAFPVTLTQVPPISSLPPTPHAKVGPRFFPPLVTIPSPTVPTQVLGEARSDSLLEDLLTGVLQGPGYHLNQNQLEVKAGQNLQDEIGKNISLTSAQTEVQTTHIAREINTVVQPGSEFTPKVLAATPKPKEAKFITEDLNTKEPNPATESNENISKAKLVKLTHKPNMTQPTGKPRTVQLVDTKDTKVAVKQNRASLARPQQTKPSAKPQLATAKTPSTKPMKINRGSKNEAIRKPKDKKGKKDNKTRRPAERKKVTTPMHFPYFKDNYCPPECACYGRVVQCSDKGVDKVPYGIPYNARYILLMNNHIDSIQLDLLSEYVSMEFLVLSNNRLTDGTIEGAFEGVPALKRLYLDRNLLESVPTDLPVSLEELRLDNNQLGAMSEAAWARCPGLLVLSLSNNSLGNGSESLPNAAFSPLCSLRTLNLDHNQLTSVPLGLPLSIKELYLKGNRIEQFRGGAFAGISELVVLDLSANRLTNKGLLRESLLNATHLESLNLEGNRLKQVPRYLPRSLKTLNLEGNLISSIKKAAFSTLKNLEHLGLARNKLFRVAIGAFRALPVLHQLDLCHNVLRQVPRQLPQGLHSVALAHNKIQSVPRDAFCWGNNSLSLSRLVRVQLEHNLIDMGDLDARAFRCLRGFQVVHFY